MITRFSRGSRVAIALVAGALTLTACGSSSSNSPTNTASGAGPAAVFKTGFVGSTGAGTPKQGGQLVVNDYGEPRSLNPTVTYANGATGGSAMAAIYDELMRYDYTTNTFVPELAESLSSSDNKVWTLKLRSGVKFTDGTPLDSAAVLGSIKYYESKYGFQTGLLLTNVASMTAPDASTVVFTLRSAWTGFPNMLSQGPGMIMAPAAYANPAAFKPIGAGPFVFGNYAPGESLILNANKDYFSGRPYLDSLKFIWVGGTQDQPKVDSVNNGSVDTAYLRDPQVITKAKASGLSGMMFSLGLGDNLWINTRTGRPGANPLVRQAISYAFDGAAYVKRVNNDTAVATRSLFAPSSPWFTASTQTYDLAKAKNLLQQAKAQGYDGHLTYVYSAAPASATGAVLIQAMLQAAGFTVTLKPLQSVADQVQTLYTQHNFDLAIGSSSIPDQDPYSRVDTMFSANSPTNLSGWHSPEMDALLAQLASNDTPETGKAIMAQIQQLWDTNVPGISVDASGVFQIWGKNVHGIEPTAETMMLYGKAWKS